MATRNLMDVFLLMRNNALQSKHIFSEQTFDDRAALVTYQDVEMGRINSPEMKVPPVWVEGLEEIHYIVSKIRQKMKDLTAYHDKHVSRPTLDDHTLEENEIEGITQELTRMFVHCQRLLQRIKNKSQNCINEELRLRNNVVISLATSLQELSTSFSQEQSHYLKRLKSRDEQSQLFIDTPLIPTEEDNFVHGEPLVSLNDQYDQAFLRKQKFMVEDNTEIVQQREKEISHIVQSITELNEIFKDLAHMVSDQGTVIDRIDYNIENVQTHVHQGLQQLRKADTYQRKNHKMMCILVLAASTIFLFLLLVIFKL